MNTEEQGVHRKITAGRVLGLVFGVSFGFMGVLGVIASDFILGIILVSIGIVLIPALGDFVQNKWNFALTKTKKTIFVVAGLFLFGFALEPSESPQVVSNLPATTEVAKEAVVEVSAQDAQKALYNVVKVVDGDTVAVSDTNGKEEVLRLIGINTPETVDPRKPVECFGKEASNKSKEILTGKKVSLESDGTQGERDKYNRLLRYVFLEDGTNFNKLMIEEGYAYEYTYNTPYKYQEEYKVAQKSAREQKKGLWADDTCNGQMTKSVSTSPPITVPTSSSDSDVATSTQVTDTESAATGTCAGKRTCGQMANCKEAYFYLNTCGVGGLDRDKDGIPCETICN